LVIEDARAGSTKPGRGALVPIKGGLTRGRAIQIRRIGKGKLDVTIPTFLVINKILWVEPSLLAEILPILSIARSRPRARCVTPSLRASEKTYERGRACPENRGCDRYNVRGWSGLILFGPNLAFAN
jgi:hypothetical protein